VKVTDRRTAVDFAHCMRDLVDVHYPDADRIRVVLDNLSSHSLGALYEAFPPKDVHRILRRLEFHHTPKHASWLNMVKIEIGVLRAQCIDRRIPDRGTLEREIDAWERQRNQSGSRIEWLFTTDRAGSSSQGATHNPPKSHNSCAAPLGAEAVLVAARSDNDQHADDKIGCISL
jgi:hypothetical protein